MKATIPLVARKGRASYLGERSAGHQDPGATSSWLFVKTVADTWAGGSGGSRSEPERASDSPPTEGGSVGSGSEPERG
jgi:hypothetical protein